MAARTHNVCCLGVPAAAPDPPILPRVFAWPEQGAAVLLLWVTGTRGTSSLWNARPPGAAEAQRRWLGTSDSRKPRGSPIPAGAPRAFPDEDWAAKHTHSYVRHHPEQLLFGIHSHPSCAGGLVAAVGMWPVGTGWLRSCFCGRWGRTCLSTCTQPSVHTHAPLRAPHVTRVLEVPGPGRNRCFLNSILRLFF